ncbi:NAD(P)-dependent oxidoreductase [Daejeonella lutea]|uniref:D-3-phosphoglycerate dehydrogenase n=1 Tax=Daejeonella lutea TaxID=572036 RepID=A0A1T5E8N3_9SPHI|nr:NAD(P)-dependent oxidoreductase [Daejeonella lutea]SKB80241.1 D-3-phosphoglycerate dehydrogenase [Daejeonella lutea]
MDRKILIADQLHPVFKERAEKLGYLCDDMPGITRAETLDILKDYSGIAIRTKFLIDREIIDAGTKLRFIARAGAGMDNVDEEYAIYRGITCINAPEGNRDAVGEHVIGMLLSLLNKLQNGDHQIRNGVWDREGNRGLELKGKTVAIVGYGNNGRSLARKLSGFEVNVIAYDKYKTGFSDAYATEVSMEQVVKQADILSFHIPLTRETKHLFNDEYLFHFKKPIVLLNASRGEVVNTQTVVKGLSDGRIWAAGLDVLEVEKFPDLAEQNWFNELKKSDKVILSPHVAGWSVESYRKISEVLAEKLKLI